MDSNETTKVKRVRLCWDSRNPSQLLIGYWPSSRCNPPIHTSIPFPTTTCLTSQQRRDVYNATKQFCVWFNTPERITTYGCELEFVQQTIYADLFQATQQLNWYRDHELRARQQEEARERREEQRLSQARERDNAKQRGRQLCLQTTGPHFTRLVELGNCFYMTSERGERFIIDPTHKNTIWLAADEPKGLCVYFNDADVQNNKFDWFVATYLHLKKDPTIWFTTANEYYSLRTAQWSPLHLEDSSCLLYI